MTGRSSKSKTSATTVQTPQPPSWLSQPYQGLASSANSLLSMNPSSFTTPATANQTQAFGRAAAGTGDPTAAASTATQGLLGYTPQNVSAGQLSNTDLSPYMNPFENDVVNSTLGDWSHGNDMALNSLRAATPSGAFGGSRQGVAEGTLLGDNSRTLASTLSQLLSANFSQAQGAASTDISNKLNADQFNVNSGLQNQQQQLGVANQLGQLDLAGAANTRADTQLMSDQGAAERSIDSSTNPNVANIDLLNTIASLLGQVPIQAFTPQTTQQDSTTKNSSNPGLLGTVGQIAQIAGSLGNPFKF